MLYSIKIFLQLSIVFLFVSSLAPMYAQDHNSSDIVPVSIATNCSSTPNEGVTSRTSLPILQNERNRPSEYLCAITLDVMTDPVVIEDGYTYERSAIQFHFSQCKANGAPLTSPVTNAILTTDTLYPNHTLRKLINDWRRRPSISENLSATVQLQNENHIIQALLARLAIAEGRAVDVALSPPGSAAALPIVEQLTQVGFGINEETMYRTYSETFATFSKPFSSTKIIESKEKIGRELFLSAMDLSDNSKRARLIESSANLGISAACLYHYNGAKFGRYGFSTDVAKVLLLQEKYSSVQSKTLQKAIHEDILKALKDKPDDYLTKMLEMAENRSEVAVITYLEVMRDHKMHSKRHSKVRCTSKNCPFAKAKTHPPHANLVDAVKYYISRGSEIAIGFYYSANLWCPEFTIMYRNMYPPRRFLDINRLTDFYYQLNPASLGTESYRGIVLDTLQQESTDRDREIAIYGKPADYGEPSILPQKINEKLGEYAQLGSEIAIIHQFERLRTVSTSSYCPRDILMAWVAEGSRVGQLAHIDAVASGKYGFEKDSKLARQLRVEYGILQDSYVGNLPYFHADFSFWEIL